MMQNQGQWVEDADNFDQDYDIVNRICENEEGISKRDQLKFMDLFFKKWNRIMENFGQ